MRGISPGCDWIGAALDTASEAEGPRFTPGAVAHLGSCASCRALVASREPAALFAALALERKDEAFWLGFETRVMARIREEEREGRRFLAWRFRPQTLGLAAGAALLAIGVLLVRVDMAPGGPRRSAIPQGGSGGEGIAKGPVGAGREGLSVPPTRIPDGAIPPVGPVTGADLALYNPPGRGSRTGPGDLLPLERDLAAPSPVESVGSPTARVISINIGRSPAKPGEGASDVVLIVDKGIDI